ncbi:MAG: undecaprenyl-diphosphate phosphatase [Oscillospiraceae bacterium]|nr:undecaprenyl-diphosphate phosphatase [Oscillospiraceae bacterium]
MTVWNAVLIGLVQGLAEFFPISNSGHLSVVNNLFKLSDVAEDHALFTAMIRLAAIVAVCLVYWPEIVAMYYELLSFANLGPYAGVRKERYPAARVFIMIVLATLPLFLILPFREMMQILYDRNVYIGVAMILTGCMLYVSDRMIPGKKTEASMTISDALIIGLCQCMAMFPGLSRIGVAIIAGLAVGLKRHVAVRFAFLLSLPALLGSFILSLGTTFQNGVDWSCAPAYLVGTVVALLASLAAIYLMRYISKNGKFGGFAYYCWIVGVLSIILYLIF